LSFASSYADCHGLEDRRDLPDELATNLGGRPRRKTLPSHPDAQKYAVVAYETFSYAHQGAEDLTMDFIIPPAGAAGHVSWLFMADRGAVA